MKQFKKKLFVRRFNFKASLNSFKKSVCNRALYSNFQKIKEKNNLHTLLDDGLMDRNHFNLIINATFK